MLNEIEGASFADKNFGIGEIGGPFGNEALKFQIGRLSPVIHCFKDIF